MKHQKTYWFPAKKYGWGWGMPSTWQGRIVLRAFFVLLGIGAVVLLPGYGPMVFVTYCAGLCLVLVWVCWIKGEPPRWRWGDE